MTGLPERTPRPHESIVLKPAKDIWGHRGNPNTVVELGGYSNDNNFMYFQLGEKFTFYLTHGETWALYLFLGAYFRRWEPDGQADSSEHGPG